MAGKCVSASLSAVLLIPIFSTGFETTAQSLQPPCPNGDSTSPHQYCGDGSTHESQSARPAFHGRILDPSRRPISGARVTALRNDSSANPSTTSDQAGEFTLDLEAGAYMIKVEATGFEVTVESMDVSRIDSGPHEFMMRLAGRSDTIMVIAEDGYNAATISSGTKTLSPIRDLPQSITVVTRNLMKDQLMMGIADVVRYVPGITAHQGENNRDQLVIRGNSSSADFFLNGARDDVQYYRDLYNLERVEALKGPDALIFGRGGAGGVINRVTKEAGFAPLSEFTLQGGSFGNKRFTADFDRPLNDKIAFRLNGMYENSDSFRDFVGLKRFGISPALSIAANARTKFTIGYERFRDDRVADRGIPSYQGRPVNIDISTFFGDPDESHVRARLNLGSLCFEHQSGNLNIRNRATIGDYDRGYQNYVPGAVSADKILVSLSAYNNATQRRNLFNQTDLTYSLKTGQIRHIVLAGTEIGRQLTDNFRNTGYFNNTSTTISAPLANPTINTPVTFRQSATDADNHIKVGLAAAYVQDQIELTKHVQAIGGLRFDYFDLQYANNRNYQILRRIDRLLSPRAGILFKPITPLSIYGSYSVSHLPSSGDQFSSLTTITQQVKPEKFSNYELGVKWDVRRHLSLTTAAYRLDRTNTRATDPNDPAKIIQTGSQRTNGFEFGLNGSIWRSWSIAGGYARQNAFITSATTAALAGAQVAQVPHHTLSIWNKYQFLPRLGAGLGVIRRTDMFAAIDNTVVLPGYTRVDAAVFYSLSERMRLQFNVENLFNKKYYSNADNNTNISPGLSRAFRLALNVGF